MDDKKPVLTPEETQVIAVFWFALIDRDLRESLFKQPDPAIWARLGISEQVFNKCAAGLRGARDKFDGYQLTLYRTISEDPHPDPPCRMAPSMDVLREVLHLLLLFAKPR